eukprot:16085668-Heterocapsa_arctica.AAC.1
MVHVITGARVAEGVGNNTKILVAETTRSGFHGGFKSAQGEVAEDAPMEVGGPLRAPSLSSCD